MYNDDAAKRTSGCIPRICFYLLGSRDILPTSSDKALPLRWPKEEDQVIHAVVIEGAPAAVDRSIQIIRRLSGGWVKVQNSIWVVETRMSAEDLRNLLSTNVRGLQILVMELSGNWAITGFVEQANWLKAAHGCF